ncbi:uncharacterized protein BDZ99DRAFT_469812 [Mytilinidion resinicola]|uniref:Uncharacterized protein n=1 Tax=Mytilinidion resinicola TaxID=574789 RepID=A0A6A6XY98_9PEZI|nr:uncharacterized protein BDZ99DRAFT_469812 [Mytilinidion resinicola]KAF2801248.1 hypothetical protein BDZ99DRAFT_469812 [Mytilinidion resinicola]
MRRILPMPLCRGAVQAGACSAVHKRMGRMHAYSPLHPQRVEVLYRPKLVQPCPRGTKWEVCAHTLHTLHRLPSITSPPGVRRGPELTVAAIIHHASRLYTPWKRQWSLCVACDVLTTTGRPCLADGGRHLLITRRRAAIVPSIY